ncbi:uncharacterized protein C3orf38 homolog [Oscarella lobularis]|uniref:uncharacterized protein C3orf38 homolog n=1 Tax=Oscarella lobularis TaxID=121494 RepID=UPI003313C5F0
MSGAPQPYNVLAEIERRELKILLGKLSTEDIISLMDTVCNRMVTTESREEALENILTYSESAKQLLRRKKVRREHIFQYLAENQVYASASADKTTLMKKVLELWGTPADAMPVDFGLDVDPLYPPSEFTNGVNYGGTPLSSLAPPPPPPPPPPPSFPTANPLDMAEKAVEHAARQSIAESLHAREGQSLAEKFTPWFYNMLCNSSTSSNSGGGGGGSSGTNDPLNTWGPQHFWGDAQLILYTLPSGKKDEYVGADDVSQALGGLVVGSGLYLRPNLSADGVKGALDPQGWVVVSVAGTMHRGLDCVGVFKECFQLIKDPSMTNNYRIKYTRLNLISGQLIQQKPTADQPAALVFPTVNLPKQY